MQVTNEMTRKFATLGPLVLRPTLMVIYTGHISALRAKHLLLNLVYLLNSRSIFLPLLSLSVDKLLAKFFLCNENGSVIVVRSNQDQKTSVAFI